MFAFKELMAWYEDKLHTQIKAFTEHRQWEGIEVRCLRTRGLGFQMKNGNDTEAYSP